MGNARDTAVESSPTGVSARPFVGTSAETVWDFSWNESLPRALGTTGATVKFGTFDEAMRFYGPAKAAILSASPQNAMFLWDEYGDAKQRFYRQHADFFLFEQEGETLGFLTGHPTDWSSYYIRYVALHPNWQGRRIYQSFVPHLLEVLQRHGVDRLDIDVSAGHRQQVHLQNKLGFVITAIQASERWGLCLRFTRFLSERHLAAFDAQFLVERISNPNQRRTE